MNPEGGLWSRLVDAPEVTDRRISALRRLVAVSALVLVAATWRLWTPQDVYPRVPLVRWALTCPPVVDFLLLAGMIGSLVVMLAARGRGRWTAASQLGFVATMAGLMLLDQHRIQPWAYQFALISLLLASCPPSRAVSLTRWLTISIYLYSAASKCDYFFLHTLGLRFVAALAHLVGLSSESWSPAARLAAAWSFPLGEISIAIGLTVCTLLASRERQRPERPAFILRLICRLALFASIIMHLLLIAVLSPLGLHHKPAVLVWNAYFIGQNLILFGSFLPQEGDVQIGESRSAQRRIASWAAQAVVVAALILPALEPWDWWDVWPSWGLYSVRAERVSLYVYQDEFRPLPPALQPYLVKHEENGPWLQVHLDRMSLELLDAPIYPQARFQLGVAAGVIERYQIREFQIAHYTRHDRFSGKRDYRALIESMDRLEEVSDKYWLNARPTSPMH